MHGIGIASRTYDLDGALYVTPLPDGSKILGNTRRISRTKTLDGGVVFTDGGARAGDRTLEISIESTEELWDQAWNLFQGATWVTISTEEACFLGKISECTERDGKIRITVLVDSDLTV